MISASGRSVRDPASKAGRIRKLLDRGLTPQQIAPRIPCSDAYVRLIRMYQREGVPKALKAWRSKNPKKVKQWRHDKYVRARARAEARAL